MKYVDVLDRPATVHAARTPGDVNMSDRALAFVEKLALEAPLKRFLEVGVFKAVTTSLLARTGPTVAIDTFTGNPEFASPGKWARTETDYRNRRDGFLSALDSVGVRANVTVLTGNSHDVLPLLVNDRFGLVVVDADHSEEAALRDITDTWDLVVPGGFLVLDDFSQVHVGGILVPTVRRAWERFALARLTGTELELLTPANDGTPPKTVAIPKPGTQ